MARSKKGPRKRFKRETLDWVTNDATYGRAALFGVPAGGLVAVPLTIPQMQQNIPSFGLPFPAGGWSYPEPNAKLRVKAVRGSFHVQPTTWAVGTNFMWVARIVQKPMDFATGAAIADALYTLDNSEYANELFSWQKVQQQQFAGGPYSENISVMASINKSLEPDEALFFILENVGNTTLNIIPYFRTLVVT